MRDVINEIVGNVFKNEYCKVEFGYDCVRIIIDYATPISFDLFESLRDKLGIEMECMCFGVVRGDIVLDCDVSDFILNMYGSWEEYDRVCDSFDDFLIE